MSHAVAPSVPMHPAASAYPVPNGNKPHMPMQSGRNEKHGAALPMHCVSVQDAARRLGVSVDTVRRRVRSGILQGHHDASGRMVVELPTDGPSLPAEGDVSAEVAALRAHVATLTAELTARRREAEASAQAQSVGVKLLPAADSDELPSAPAKPGRWWRKGRR